MWKTELILGSVTHNLIGYMAVRILKDLCSRNIWHSFERFLVAHERQTVHNTIFDMEESCQYAQLFHKRYVDLEVNNECEESGIDQISA